MDQTGEGFAVDRQGDRVAGLGVAAHGAGDRYGAARFGELMMSSAVMLASRVMVGAQGFSGSRIFWPARYTGGRGVTNGTTGS